MYELCCQAGVCVRDIVVQGRALALGKSNVIIVHIKMDVVG
jgi:hypothetical protein